MQGADEVKGSEKVEIATVISCRDAAKMLEPVEASLDAIAQPIGFDIVANAHEPRAFGRNNGFGANLGDELSNRIAVVTSVGDDAASRLAVQKCRRLRQIVGLAGRENEAQRPAECVREQMDLGGQSASGTPQSLAPLFRWRPAGGRAPGWYRA